MLFPANFNFKAAALDVAKLVDRHDLHPMEIDQRCGLCPRNHFFSRVLDCRRAANAIAHVLAIERKAADCILVMEVAASRYLPFSSSHQRSHLADAHGNNQWAYKR
jgi:hypothetical protein